MSALAVNPCRCWHKWWDLKPQPWGVGCTELCLSCPGDHRQLPPLSESGAPWGRTLGLRWVMRHWDSLLTRWPSVGILCQSQGKDWARGGSLGSGPSRPGQRVWSLRVPLEATWVEQLNGPGTT